MKQKQLLKPLFLLCALLVGGLNSLWAEDVTYSLTPNGTNTGSTSTTYITTLTEFTSSGISWKMNQWNPSTLQIKTNQSSAASEFRFYNTSAFPGRITKVVITFSALTVSDASKLMFLGGTSEVTATTGGTAGTWNSTTKTLTWTPGASDNFTYFAFYQNGKAASGTNYLASENAIVVTYESSGSTTTACATPTFNPKAGVYTSAQNVTINTTTDGATIYYTTDGTDPTTNSNAYTAAIKVSTTTTIKAIAVKDGMDNSTVATATYLITEHAGTEADAYTVADARAAIDANEGITEVYVKGTVSEIVEEYSTKYSNITFNIVDNEGDELFLQAFRCEGDEAANVQTGDIAVVSGNLTKYGSTYEFSQGCQLVSLTHTASTTPVINASDVELTYDATSGEITYSINNPVTETSLTATTTASWITDITVGTDKVTFTTSANTGEERTGTITLTYGTLTKDVTVTQAKYEEYTWVKTELANLSATDVFVIVGDNGSTYAMSNDNGTGSAPVATAVNITGDSWTGAIADNLLWNISGNATDGYTFYPNGTTETWLYCTNVNNGVRVGTNAGNKTFTLDGDYLKNTATSRYVGIYNSQDWRCYTSNGGNIENQTFAFYKKGDPSVTISDVGYKAYNTVIDTDFSGTGVTAYVVTGYTTESVTLEEVTTAPAGTPLVLKGDEGTHALNKAENAAKPAKNLLTVSNGTVGDGATIYALANVKGPGFYVVKEGLTIPTNYIVIPAGNAPALSFDFGEGTTGIRSIENGQLTIDNVYYDLSGRKLNAMPTQKGVYIVNGKKVVIK